MVSLVVAGPAPPSGFVPVGPALSPGLDLSRRAVSGVCSQVVLSRRPPAGERGRHPRAWTGLRGPLHFFLLLPSVQRPCFYDYVDSSCLSCAGGPSA